MGSSLLVALALSSSAGSRSVRHNGTQESGLLGVPGYMDINSERR
jgi:hypothetical protein